MKLRIGNIEGSTRVWEAGIAPKPRLGNGHAIASMYSLDPFTLPGVLRMSPAASLISSTTVVDLPVNVVPEGTDLWWLGDAGNIYKSTSADVVSKQYTSSNTEGYYGLTVHHDGTAKYLYWRAAQEIGRYDFATTYNDDYIVGLTDQGDKAPLLSFINNLYYANGEYIGRKEGGAAGDDTYLQLPANFTAKQLIIYGTWIVINCKNNETTKNESKILFWDGIKTDYQDTISVPHAEVTLFNDAGNVYGLLGSRNPYWARLIGRRFKSINRIESWSNHSATVDGSDDVALRGLDLPRPGAIIKGEGTILFGSNPQMDIYAIGNKYLPNAPYAIHKLYKNYSNVTQLDGEIGAIFYKEGSTPKLYVGAKREDGAAYTINMFTEANTHGSGTFVTPVLDMSTRRKKTINYIQLYFSDLQGVAVGAAGDIVLIRYKKDGGALTTLKQIKWSDEGGIRFYKVDWGKDSVGREFEFAIELSTDHTGTVGFYGMEIDYDLAPEK